MTIVPPLPDAHIEKLAQELGEACSGSDINRWFADKGITDNSHESTKWRRLFWAFRKRQLEDNSANQVLSFIQEILMPARFIGRSDAFESHSEIVNAILSFSGIEYGSDGKFREREIAQTLEEAEMRVRRIKAKFKDRRLHPEVLKYCNAELLQDNYFHAVFEATKGLAQRIRDSSGVDADGAKLVDRVFSTDRPILAFNSLQTETERSEHRGFATLLKGCFAAVRNPLAHEPKLLWEGEDDAADYLSLISLLHRKLDDCVPTQGRID